MSAAESVPWPKWLTESQAAEYAGCSLSNFRTMRLPAYNSGGRKVYCIPDIDAAIRARPWQPSTSVADPSTFSGASAASNSAVLSARLTGKRLKPYAPRKRRSSLASSSPE